MRKQIACLAFTLITASACFGQMRSLTSTYAFNQLLINPAYAGNLNLLSVTAVHRQQWINIEGAPSFSNLNAHSSFMDNKIGVGINFMSDNIGVTTTNSLYGSYAYKIRMRTGIFSMGLQGGFDNRRSDYTRLTIYNTNDQYLTGVNNRFTPNFGVGLYFANPNFYAGVSVPYLLENRTLVIANDVKSADSRESRYYYATSGVILPLTDGLKLSPSFLLRIQEQNRIAYDITCMVIFDQIAYAGLSVRNSKDLTFLGQIILNENLRVGYAYDANLQSDINTTSAGSHEILINYRIKLRNYRNDPQCPVYF